MCEIDFSTVRARFGLLYPEIGFRHESVGEALITSFASRCTGPRDFARFYSSSAYAPFGEQYKTSGTADASFTGQNSDTVSSLYDFEFREFSPSQGRWISPDPAGMAAVNPGNPQSWNRYAYVLNRPLMLVDTLGLDCAFYLPVLVGGERDGYWTLEGYFCSGPDDPLPSPPLCSTGKSLTIASCNNSPKPANCGITVKCRGIQANSLGKLGFQHCDAGVLRRTVAP
jgi:RHS repeat-associated protein